MSTWQLAFLLAFETGIIAILMVPFYLIRRRSLAALSSLPVYGGWAYLVYCLGGGVANRQTANLHIFVTVFWLLFFQAVLGLVIAYDIHKHRNDAPDA